ncbi:MAG: hypothetical protein HY978_01240 [Candidatus Liptonbacteria bacterium]|nr:hypothetical protein [Candidatus Liptonbacteria bacterium]
MNEVARTAKEGTIELSVEMRNFSSRARRWHEKRFCKFGVLSPIRWTEQERIFKLRNPSSMEEGNITALRAGTSFGYIVLHNLTKEKLVPSSLDQRIRDDDHFHPIAMTDEKSLGGMTRPGAAKAVREYIEARQVLHELYHDAAPFSLLFRTVRNKATGENEHVFDSVKPLERRGLGYIRCEAGLQTPAVEEGLAMLAEEDADNLLQTQFPKGKALYAKLLNYVAEKDPRLDNFPEESRRIFNFDGSTVSFGSQSAAAFLLVSRLRAEIPEFQNLAEQARIDGKILPLARAVEKRFGRKSYRKIMTCSVDEAYDIGIELGLFATL